MSGRRVFIWVRIPTVNSGSRDPAVIEYDGQISILDYLVSKRESKWEMEVLILGDPHKQAWTRKQFPMPPDLVCMVPAEMNTFLCSVRGCELLFGPEIVSQDPYRMFIYSMKDCSVRTVEICGILDFLPSTRRYRGCDISIYDHVESLAMICQM